MYELFLIYHFILPSFVSIIALYPLFSHLPSWYGCTVVRMYGSKDVRLYGFLRIHVLYSYIWFAYLYHCLYYMYGCISISTIISSICMDVSMYGCMAVQMYGCTEVRMYDCM